MRSRSGCRYEPAAVERCCGSRSIRDDFELRKKRMLGRRSTRSERTSNVNVNRESPRFVQLNLLDRQLVSSCLVSDFGLRVSDCGFQIADLGLGKHVESRSSNLEARLTFTIGHCLIKAVVNCGPKKIVDLGYCTSQLNWTHTLIS